MIKIIEISYMINGVDMDSVPCKTIETQVQEIFDNNKDYTYIDLVYKPKDNVINVEYATLIVDDEYK